MFKTLLIFRHATTEPFSDNGQDFSRNLTDGGLQEADKMGDRIAVGGLAPEVVCCSAAARTRQTLESASVNWKDFDPIITYLDDLYLASAGDLLSFINGLSDGADTVMIVGHNPGLHQLVQLLTDEIISDFSPATLAVLSSDCTSWEEIAPASMQLQRFLQTKD